MTISYSFLTVIQSISQISISGINMKAANQIPENAQMETPCFFLAPDNSMTNSTQERVSFGGAGTALMNANYTLNYRYLHAPIGTVGSLFTVYPAMLTNLKAILEAIAANDNISGAVDMTFGGITHIGALADPAGSMQYHGMEFALNILEFIQ